MTSLFCSEGKCLLLGFGQDLLRRALGYLNIQDLRRVYMASRRFEALHVFVAEETLRWVVNSCQLLRLGSNWELRVDSVKMIFDTVEEARQQPGEVEDSDDQADDSDASVGSEQTFKPIQIKIKQCVVRRPLAGDAGPLGKCYWASEGASLWFKRRPARGQNSAAGKSLDIQLLALLKLWRPPEAANVRNTLSAGNASMSFSAAALRCFVEWLDPDMGEAIRENESLAERLSIKQGNMLEILAVSNVDVDLLVDPVAILVRCGATAGGQYVLEALRKATQDQEINEKWTGLWASVAATQLRKALTEFQASEAENVHDHELAVNLEDAAIAGLATNVDICLLEKVMTILAKDLDSLRSALWSALITECSQQAPHHAWLIAWLRAGAGEKNSAWLDFEMVREYYYGELPEKTPLSHIGRSDTAPHLLIGCVSCLVEYGDFGGLVFSSDASEVILGALKKAPTEEPMLSQWRLAWCSAARARLRWALDHDSDEIEEALAVARDVGLSGHEVELAERIQARW